MDYHPLYRHQSHLLGFVLLLTAGLAGCSLFGDDDACDTRFTDSVRVIPCGGVDGVRFGDTRAEVEARLGPPDGTGWSQGTWRGWRLYTYLEGPHAGLTVYYIDKEGYSDEEGFGPIDSFLMKPPYPGKTREGIGLGSSTEAVTDAYGEPVKIRTTYLKDQPEPNYDYLYCFEDKLLNVGIEEGRVTGLSIGYHIRMPEAEYHSLCY